MKHLAKYRVELIILGLATTVVVAVVAIRAQTSPSVHPAVISYTEASYPLAGGPPKNVRSETLGVRADGSVSVARLVQNPVAAIAGPFYNLRIVDVPGKSYLVVDQFTKSITTYPSEIMAAAREIHPLTSCPGAAGPKMLGFDTVLQEETRTSPGTTVTSRYWRSPTVNCLPLRVEKTVQHPDGEGAVSIRNATAVSLTEPPAWMFEVPVGYAERTPSEVLSEASRLTHTGLGAPAGLDGVYKNAQKQRSAK